MGYTHQGFEVDMDDAEAVFEALRPLEVVQQRPCKVSLDQSTQAIFCVAKRDF